MWKFLTWLIGWTLALCAIWQLSGGPLVPSVLSLSVSGPVLLVAGLVALGLIATGLIVGLRIGAKSATRYVKDLQQKNSFLAELCTGLAKHNHALLKSMLAEEEGVPSVGSRRKVSDVARKLRHG